MSHKRALRIICAILLVSSLARGEYSWLQAADPTKNIPTLPSDLIELDNYLSDGSFLFDNLEGGVWRQGWDIEYDDKKWEEEPLNVFVVMHSHNDPGWQKTFEDYFQQQTKGIINTIVNTLDKDSTKRFIWAEISFFSRWWETVDDTMKAKAKKVIANGQLEIVTGGWVMNDEATVHYLAMINQLTMGHIWLEQNIGVVPTTGWAIDPFGHSPTMASILNQAGFKAMIINRVHYYIKKVLAWNKSLEFRWRQQWDTDESNNEMLAHMFPFFSYDMAHTCGPNPKICSQFEFVNHGTLWGDSVPPITEANVDARAQLIVDQYKKKASLFRTGNNVLIPLGDDFKYFDQNYMDTMTRNFDPLFKHINENRSKFKVNVRFATLGEYFDAVAESAGKVMAKSKEDRDYKEFFPAIKGDFFTYDDVREDYWSGYYTSRPFWKNLDRQMEPSMRAAEMMLAWTRGLLPARRRADFDAEGHFAKLLEGRKLWSIFQHHDGMTGTARKHVVVDYGHMLHTALWNAKTVMQDLLPTLLGKAGVSHVVSLNVNEEQAQSSDVVQAKLLDMNEHEEIALVIYNSLTRARTEILVIHVNTPKIDIVNADGESIDFQLSPILRADLSIIPDQYKVYFRAELMPVTVSTVFVRRTDQVKADAVPKITAVRCDAWPSSFLDKSIGKSIDSELRISNNFFDISFDQSTGLMSSINVRKLNFRSGFKEDYAAYEATGGAYLFSPTGPAKSFAGSNHPLVLIEGSLVSETMTKLPEIVTRTVRVYNIDEYEDNSRFIEVENHVDLKKENREVVNRYTVDSIRNENSFFTDLNGFSFRKRFIRTDKPIQFNFYPITETTFMQDSAVRFSVNTQQPLGVGTLKSGELELVLDRRLSKDDARGLAEPVQDNLPMVVKFQLTFEQTPRPATDIDERAVARSLHGLDRALKFNNPVTVFSAVMARSDWLQSYASEKSLLSPNSALVVRSDMHLTAFKLRDPLDADTDRRDETIVQVMRYLYDIKEGDGEDTSPFEMNIAREFDVLTLVDARRRSITTVREDPNDEAGIGVQRVVTWLADVAPTPADVVTRPKAPTAKSPVKSPAKTPKGRTPKSGSDGYTPRKEISTNHVASDHSAYIKFAMIVFVGSSALVVYVTWSNRRTTVRWFALTVLLSNLLNVFIIAYLLNDL